MSRPQTEVLILGHGLLGRLLAWRLHQAGIGVRWFDPHPEKAAAHVAAAMLAPLAEGVLCPPRLVAMGRHCLVLWRQWLAELGGVPFGLDGSLVLSHPQDRGLMSDFQARLPQGQWQPAQVAELEPALAGAFHQGLWLQEEGYLDNAALMARLAEETAHLETDAPELAADWVLDCRGLHAALPGLRGVRGEVARLHAPEVALSRPVRLLHPRYPLYVVPRPNGRYVVGATELESRDDGPVTVRSALELLSAAYSLHPGFGEARVESLQSGLRPALPHNEPRIRTDGNRLHIGGLYRHGYLLAPALVEATLAHLFDQPPQGQIFPWLWEQ
ncbi:FAD-dependent oxidoreductase [Gallaecimonas sp. GXIMD4217]|uniref:FAD-dependent oxidoreductase n=1 Tax=Gallaecimonas sp. GXIMD4217 TaxID=3131927 RepID=UPI00311B2530